METPAFTTIASVRTLAETDIQYRVQVPSEEAAAARELLHVHVIPHAGA